MDGNPGRRIMTGVLKMFGRAGAFGEKQDRSAFLAQEPLPQEQASEEFSVPIWTSPEGEIMHARWKGPNAVVWWPLKEHLKVTAVRKVDAEAVLCESGGSFYQFWTPALLQFLKPEELERAGRMKDLANRLRVKVAGYQIVAADLVPREQARAKKGIA